MQRVVRIAVLVLSYAVAARAQRPNCTTAVTRLADPADGGFLYFVTASCDRVVFEMDVNLAAIRLPNADLYKDGGVVPCFNTSTCSGVLRIACTPPGTYDVQWYLNFPASCRTTEHRSVLRSVTLRVWPCVLKQTSSGALSQSSRTPFPSNTIRIHYSRSRLVQGFRHPRVPMSVLPANGEYRSRFLRV